MVVIGGGAGVTTGGGLLQEGRVGAAGESRRPRETALSSGWGSRQQSFVKSSRSDGVGGSDGSIGRTTPDGKTRMGK